VKDISTLLCQLDSNEVYYLCMYNELGRQTPEQQKQIKVDLKTPYLIEPEDMDKARAFLFNFRINNAERAEIYRSAIAQLENDPSLDIHEVLSDLTKGLDVSPGFQPNSWARAQEPGLNDTGIGNEEVVVRGVDFGQDAKRLKKAREDADREAGTKAA